MRKMPVYLMLFVFILCGAATISDAAKPDQAARYPSRTIRIILPMSPGGSLNREIIAISPYLEKSLKVRTVVEFVPGGGGVIAYNKLYREQPDGYTLMYCSSASSIAVELTNENAKFSMKNFSHIASWNMKTHVLAVNADLWKTFPEFLSETKQRKVSVAGVSTAYLQTHLMETSLGIKTNYIPYADAGAGTAAVAGKHVEAVVAFPIAVQPMIRAGKLRALAVFSPKPDPSLPGVQTFKELGYGEVPSFVIQGMFIAPPGTPKAIVATLEKAIGNAAADPEFRKMAEKQAFAIDFAPAAELKTSLFKNYDLIEKNKEFVK